MNTSDTLLGAVGNREKNMGAWRISGKMGAGKKEEGV